MMPSPSSQIIGIAGAVGVAGGRMMGDGVKQILAMPIQQADQVAKLADGVQSCRQECAELKFRAVRLADLLRQAARAAELYERPARRIILDTEQVLDKALSLVSKCRPHGLMKRVFTIIPPTGFKKMFTQLDNSLADVSWLLRASSDDAQLLGLPPIAQNEPILFLIWTHIATLHAAGSLDARSDSAAALASLAGNDRYSKLIVEEDGVGPLLRLVREGRVEGQENAARALGLLARDPESVHPMLDAGACSTFAKVLREAPMRAQAVVAWAVAEIAAGDPKSQDLFAQNNVVRLLVGHLAFETVEEHSKYTIAKPTSIHSIVVASSSAAPQISHPPAGNAPYHPEQPAGNRMHSVIQSTMMTSQSRNDSGSPAQLAPAKPKPQPQPQLPPSSSGLRSSRDSEDADTKSQMKAMAARALWYLAKDNPGVCKSLTESRALLCFAKLLEKGPSDDVRYNSAMALMEIARVAEHHAELRRNAFKPKSLAATAVIDQLLSVAARADDEALLRPCVTALGCLSRMFQASETRVIAPLVRLLGTESVVSREAAVALTKFACTENHLHDGHSRAIVQAGGVEHLVQLVYLEKEVQIEALLLLCYISLHIPDSEELAQGSVPAVLAWASKQGYLVQDPRVDSLLPEAKARLELYQSRGGASTGFH